MDSNQQRTGSKPVVPPLNYIPTLNLAYTEGIEPSRWDLESLPPALDHERI